MRASLNRREFLHRAAGYGVAAAGLSAGNGLAAAEKPLKVADHTLTVISGKPRERGRQYGDKFKDSIHAFLDKEIYQVCAKHAGRAKLLRYAGQWEPEPYAWTRFGRYFSWETQQNLDAAVVDLKSLQPGAIRSPSLFPAIA